MKLLESLTSPPPFNWFGNWESWDDKVLEYNKNALQLLQRGLRNYCNVNINESKASTYRITNSIPIDNLESLMSVAVCDVLRISKAIKYEYDGYFNPVSVTRVQNHHYIKNKQFEDTIVLNKASIFGCSELSRFDGYGIMVGFCVESIYHE